MSTAVLGLYERAEDAARAVASLRGAGIEPSNIEVLTDSPYPEGAFGEQPARHHLYVFPLVGAACGLVVGIVVTVATQIAFPMVQGGKPLLSIPPMINVLYEATLLGAIVLTVLGVIFESRLPDFSGDPYDARISEGFIGVLVTRMSAPAAERAERALAAAAAVDILVRTSP